MSVASSFGIFGLSERIGGVVEGKGGNDGIPTVERPLAGGHLVEDAAETPEVDAKIDLPAPHLFGSHVAGRAQDCARLREVLAVAGEPGQAEVQNPHPVCLLLLGPAGEVPRFGFPPAKCCRV